MFGGCALCQCTCTHACACAYMYKHDNFMQMAGPIGCCYIGMHLDVIPKDLIFMCLTSLTHAKCGVCSTLCWKIPNISGSIELFPL